MSYIKKQVRAPVRRSARLIIEKYYRDQGDHRSKDAVNQMVKEVERRVVPPLIAAIKK